MKPRARRHPSIGLLVVAAVVLAAGFLGPQEVTCGSQVMSPGDECVRDGVARSYADEVRAHEQQPVRFGLLAAGIAAVAVLVGLGRRPPDPTGEMPATANESVVATAARDDLGTLLGTTPWRNSNSFRNPPGRHVYRFEHGLVVDTKEGPLALPYRDVSICRDQVNQNTGGTLWGVVDWRFERSDGHVWKTGLDHKGTGNDEPLARVYEHALAMACASQREPSLRRLAEGGTVDFGRVRVDLVQLSWGDHSERVEWASVVEVHVEAGALRVKVPRDGRFVKHLDHQVARVAALPNFPLLWDVVNVAHANARAGEAGIDPGLSQPSRSGSQ